ncbi:MAG: DUF1440 domain-containing protein [Acidobacteria bacterium]|nr:DUF1440 domain-containing protein [Acidobacteriota bacterium]
MRDGRRAKGRDEGHVLKGLAAGLIGGLVASWVMEEFQAAWSKVSESPEKSQGNGHSAESGQQSQDESQSGGSPEQQQGQAGEQGGDSEEQEPATVKAAEAISEGVFGHELTKSEKEIAGPAVHYAFGTSVGGLYGAVAEVMPEVKVGAGLPFGAVFWLVADETAVPLLGLSKSPTEYPPSTHVYALASHFVYGLTTEVVRRAVRSVL